MKTMLIPGLLLAAASTYGVTSDGLTSATGLRMADYQNWFAPELSVSSDAYYVETPCPVLGLPSPFMDGSRLWTGWQPNWVPTALGGPIRGVPVGGVLTKVEFVFLGETAGWWDNLGYRLNGVDVLLADGIQTVYPDTTR